MSRDLEESLIEKKFFDYFIGTDPESKMLINKIKDDTIEHHSKLRNAWEEERKR
jgi:ferritin-like protein